MARDWEGKTSVHQQNISKLLLDCLVFAWLFGSVWPREYPPNIWMMNALFATHFWARDCQLFFKHDAFCFSENPRIQVDSYSSDQPDPTLFFSLDVLLSCVGWRVNFFRCREISSALSAVTFTWRSREWEFRFCWFFWTTLHQDIVIGKSAFLVGRSSCLSSISGPCSSISYSYAK